MGLGGEGVGRVMSETVERVAERDFVALSERLRFSIQAGQPDQVEAVVAEYVAGGCDPVENLLLQGVLHYARREFGPAVQALGEAKVQMRLEQRPELGSVYSAAFVESQLVLPRRERAATAQGYGFYRRNIAALRQIDAALAQQVQGAHWPAELVLVELWDGLYLHSHNHRRLLLMKEDIRKELDPYLTGRTTIAFAGISTGQEVRYCLEHQVDLLHGMARAHYLFEPDPAMIKVVLHLDDLGRALTREELIVFGGSEMDQQIVKKFETLRYAPPVVTVGNTQLVHHYFELIRELFDTPEVEAKSRAYYSSEEFRQRQSRIAAGEILPRVLVDTCRWTTFLQYCARDFEQAFANLGCPTRYVIEENDVQNTLPALHWRELQQFKPDVVFMVSHARPTNSEFPMELPFIGYIQDRCGPLDQLMDLEGHITKQDLFICQARWYQEYLLEKNVPTGQMFVLPVPADEKMFYPLPSDDERAGRFMVDVSFVKHGHAPPDEVFEEWLNQYVRNQSSDHVRVNLERIFKELYRSACNTGVAHIGERAMQDYVMSQLIDDTDEEICHQLRQKIKNYIVTVWSAAWRCQFLEPLDEAGIDLALYGKNWDKYPRLRHLGRGPAERKGELNFVYNFSRINLHINPVITMHQRLVECALAGGFVIAADLPEANDWESARKYFEPDKELVFFENPVELVDCCRYYLAHEQERLDIAERMHRRALAGRTVAQAVDRILLKWRELL